MLDFILASESSNGFFCFIITLNYLTNKTTPSEKKTNPNKQKPSSNNPEPPYPTAQKLTGCTQINLYQLL